MKASWLLELGVLVVLFVLEREIVESLRLGVDAWGKFANCEGEARKGWIIIATAAIR